MSAVIGGLADPGVPGRKGLDDHRQPGAEPLGRLRRFAPVQLHAPAGRPRGRSAAPGSGDSSRNTPTVTISGGSRLTMSAGDLRGDLAGRRREHEAHRVGAQGHRQQGVVLAGRAAHLDEHQRRARRSAPRRNSRTSRRRDRASRDQGLADQHGVEAGVAEAPYVVAVADPRLGHPDHAGGQHPAATRTARAGVDLEGEQVPLVDPDQRGARGQGPLRFALIVHLDQGVEPDRAGQRQELGELARRKSGRDEQDRVGAHAPGVEDVGAADGEVLAQHRQGGGGPGGHEVLGRPGEELPVGQHRQRLPPRSAS